MRARTRRLGVVGVAAALLVAASALVYVAIQQNAKFFWTPTELVERGGPEDGLAGKVGGFVEVGSLAYSNNTDITFNVVDDAHKVSVIFDGVVPDLFREGAGVIAEGTFNADGVFVASRLLAKHDETYVPRELVDVEGPAS